MNTKILAPYTVRARILNKQRIPGTASFNLTFRGKKTIVHHQEVLFHVLELKDAIKDIKESEVSAITIEIPNTDINTKEIDYEIIS